MNAPDNPDKIWRKVGGAAGPLKPYQFGGTGLIIAMLDHAPRRWERGTLELRKGEERIPVKFASGAAGMRLPNRFLYGFEISSERESYEGYELWRLS